MYQIGLTGQYLGLWWIWRKLVKVTFLLYHVTRSQRAELAIFKTCSDPLNVRRFCSVSMRVGVLQVRTRLILIYAEKFPLDKWGNLTHEYIGRKN